MTRTFRIKNLHIPLQNGIVVMDVNYEMTAGEIEICSIVIDDEVVQPNMFNSNDLTIIEDYISRRASGLSGSL